MRSRTNSMSDFLFKAFVVRDINRIIGEWIPHFYKEEKQSYFLSCIFVKN